jgi:hypothetical protein
MSCSAHLRHRCGPRLTLQPCQAAAIGIARTSSEGRREGPDDPFGLVTVWPSATATAVVALGPNPARTR